MTKQDLGKLQTRKVRALKKIPTGKDDSNEDLDNSQDVSETEESMET